MDRQPRPDHPGPPWSAARGDPGRRDGANPSRPLPGDHSLHGRDAATRQPEPDSRPAPPSRGRRPALPAGRRESFLTGRDLFIIVLVLGLLTAWVLEFAPLLHAVHAVRSTATVAASMAASGSGNAYKAARTWMEDLPGTSGGRLEIRTFPGPNGRIGRAEATAHLDYYPSTPLIRALLPRVIHLQATEERDAGE